jgi:hypothetical protein
VFATGDPSGELGVPLIAVTFGLVGNLRQLRRLALQCQMHETKIHQE